ncbi:MAG: 4-alpha-glucanotransferase [Rikenellaceae bacterium]
MRVEFELNYRVASGEAICVEFYGSATIVQMESHDGEWWRLTLDGVEPQSYGYLLCRDGEVVRRETRVKERLIEQTKGIDMVVKHDRWSEYEELRPLYSSLFTNVVFRRESPRSVELSKRGVTTVIECVAARIESSQAIAIVGDGQMLGEWGASGKVEMCDAEFPLWRVALPNVERHSEFKFVVVDRESGEIISWESGENRMLTPYRGEQGGLMSLDFVSCSTPHFDTPLWQGIGVSIPIFSLRTDRSMGIGDFGDIRSMVDWAVARDMSVLQILPINDTIMGGTWEDSYPYNSNSTIALHPQYLALREVGCIDDDELRAKFEAKAAELNALPKIDYTAVMALKMEYLREIFRKDKAATLKSKAYRGFVEQNSWWLTPYALFSMLRDRFSTPDFREWGDYAKYSEKLTEGLNRKEQSEVNFYCFLQYHLHIQLLAASNYARSRGVAIKGDIPIGVSRTSVDVWQHPDLFSLDMQAGAPPDPFSALGQNWGFPTYNWELMAKDGYSWWRARFEKMAEYFDAYRIDHILGFFRIWEIPLGSVHGLTGHFNPALPLSKSQLLEWRLEFRDEYTQPYITDEVLSMHFQSDIKEIKKNYLSKSKSGG